FAIDNVTSLRALIDDGQLRALAVTSTARQPDFPDVPTMIEAGVPDYVVTSFFGVAAPRRTPAPVIARLSTRLNARPTADIMRQNLKKLGAAPSIESPEQFTAFIADELHKWTMIADTAGIKVD